VDAPPVAAAVPQLRDAADGAVTSGDPPAMALSNNAKTALVLASIVAVFFLGIMLKYWLLR
jgi:hypothetical protein